MIRKVNNEDISLIIFMDNIENLEISTQNISLNEKLVTYLKPIFGMKIKKDIEKKFNELRTEAINSKDSELLAFFGYLYSYAEDYKEAVKWFNESNNRFPSDNLEYQLGYIYLKGGFGIEQDYQKAIEFFNKSIKHSNQDALYQLGCMYRDGKGVDKNYQKAIEFFDKASKEGNSEAMYELGLLYYCGLGIEQDEEEAKRYFRDASSQGNIRSKIALGLVEE